MKNLYLALTVSVSFLFGGSNVNTMVSEVADISNTAASCKVDKYFFEKDTKLMWQDQSYVDAEDGAYKRNHSVGKAGNWNHAVNYCRQLSYLGYSDWRLPTSDELTHVYGKDGELFTYGRGDDFWSSTPATDNRYYVVYPTDAQRYKRKMKQSNYVRCVRCVPEEDIHKDATLFSIFKEMSGEERR
ncbi:MAG: Unknown protein [uncultured Sulfurovum sp.]|uniref:Lcl C-terminal domain-containing protein n=1 Tax=uncultured Sulfurovum sp. TaxID=269237 RepID=A0A6S6TDA7_9BACT|nr:MAG: Unknown protein [uncultured Sulfurovum sp.]